ncbi:hypothetical protein INR49_014447 [Caranx melampygus]|nr:hypothetical protein INR49_014447 [Caranx melampygus]
MSENVFLVQKFMSQTQSQEANYTDCVPHYLGSCEEPSGAARAEQDEQSSGVTVTCMAHTRKVGFRGLEG